MASQQKTIDSLQEQNTHQEVMLGRLTENAKGREEAHAQHREDMQNQFARIESQLAEMTRKLDRALGNATPMPGRYSHTREGDSK
jgi:hypothetical protein